MKIDKRALQKHMYP